MKKHASAILLLACIAGSSQATISGRVVDQTGAGVYDAMVCYASLANRLIYVYADANGYFNIPNPADWKLTDLPMYKPAATIAMRGQSSQAAKPSLNAMVNGNLVIFAVNNVNRRVVADLYDLAGRQVMRVFDNVVTETGNHVFNPFARNHSKLGRQVYLLYLNDGVNTVSLRMINTGTDQATTSFLHQGQVVSLNNSPAFAKIVAVDSIRAGKTGYLGKMVLVNSYNDAVGNVVIKSLDINARVDSVLALMSDDEKIGQLMQPAGGYESDVKTYLTGSYLKGERRTEPMAASLTTVRKIPLLVGNDWVHGGRHVYFPHQIGLGCANDTLLIELAYRVNSLCCLPLQNNVTFGPCLDVHRSDKSGRVYEGFAETPELTTPLVRAAVRGIQGTDLASGYTLMATLKHWAAAGGTVDGGGHANANTAPNMGIMANIHFPPFLAGIKAGAGSVMTGYQSVFDGVMATNKQLVTDTLKTKYGFDGFVITDWATSGGKEAACVNAGHDMCMTVKPNTFRPIIQAALQNGAIPKTRLDDAVRRVLRAKFRLGLFENPWPNLGLNNYLSSQEYRDVARACVRKTLVLLKNDAKTLPLSKTAKIHVVGAWADNLGYQCGGWSATGISLADSTNTYTGNDEWYEGWQGTNNAHTINGATTILQAIRSVQPAATYAANATGIPEDANVVVVVVGETPYAEDAGDRTDISLSAEHQSLVQACKASGKPVVTILITGRPNVLGTIPANSSALVAAWLPGTEGKGISDVLFGDFGFVGKLSHTWPKNTNQDPINFGAMGDKVGSDVTAPLYAYGFGLTY
jgi:beta-glucosidase